MNQYEKPIVLVNEELAEGVYAASGSVAGDSSSGGVSSSVELKKPGNPYYKINEYIVTVTNSGSEDLQDWATTVSVTAGTATEVTTYDGWRANVSLNGSTITITSNGSGAPIPAGKSIEVSVVVTYSSDSVTVE